MWGNYGVAGHEFELSDASDAWNCWFADGKGDWYVTVDTKSKTWSAANIMTVKVNGMDMTYDSSTDSWSTVMKVDDNTRLTAQADAKEYNTTTRTSSSKDISLALADTTLAKGGTYTVTLAIQPADAQFHFSVVEGEKKPDEKPQTPLPATLSMYSKDGSTLLATLNQTETKGVYTLRPIKPRSGKTLNLSIQRTTSGTALTPATCSRSLLPRMPGTSGSRMTLSQ